jgi:hypothetical protein
MHYAMGNEKAGQIQCSSRQRRTQVLAAILGVHMVEVVRAWPDVIDRAFGGVIDGIVVLLAELGNLT